jgi:hypothetical protein
MLLFSVLIKRVASPDGGAVNVEAAATIIFAVAILCWWVYYVIQISKFRFRNTTENRSGGIVHQLDVSIGTRESVFLVQLRIVWSQAPGMVPLVVINGNKPRRAATALWIITVSIAFFARRSMMMHFAHAFAFQEFEVFFGIGI